MKLNMFFVFISIFCSGEILASCRFYDQDKDHSIVCIMVKALCEGNRFRFDAISSFELQYRRRYQCENMLTPKQAYKQVSRLRKKACKIYLYWRLDQRKPKTTFAK